MIRHDKCGIRLVLTNYFVLSPLRIMPTIEAELDDAYCAFEAEAGVYDAYYAIAA